MITRQSAIKDLGAEVIVDVEFCDDGSHIAQPFRTSQHFVLATLAVDLE